MPPSCQMPGEKMYTHRLQDLPSEPPLIYKAKDFERLMMLIRANVYEVLTLC